MQDDSDTSTSSNGRQTASHKISQSMAMSERERGQGQGLGLSPNQDQDRDISGSERGSLEVGEEDRAALLGGESSEEGQSRRRALAEKEKDSIWKQVKEIVIEVCVAAFSMLFAFTNRPHRLLRLFC
jgi:hypothetical protein